MLRLTFLLTILAADAAAVADDREPLELTFVLIDLQWESQEADADSELPDLRNPGAFESDDWDDELLRLRSKGVDVRVRQIVVTAYDGLPARVQLFEENHVCDVDGQDEGTRRQAILDLRCTPTRQDDGVYSLELSSSDQARNDAPWEEPVLQDVPAESSFPPFNVRAVNTSIDVPPSEWQMMGGLRSSSTNESGLRSESSEFTLIHVSEE